MPSQYPTSPADRLLLAEITDRAVVDIGAPAAQIAAALGITPSGLSQYRSGDRETPSPVLWALLRRVPANRRPALLERMGALLWPVEVEIGDATTEVQDAVEAIGSAVAPLSRALRDGQVTVDEAVGVRAELVRVRREVDEGVAALDALIATGPQLRLRA